MLSRRVLVTLTVLLMAGLSVVGGAGEPLGDPAVRAALDSFRTDHGASWQVRWTPDGSRPAIVFGGSVEPLVAPDELADYEFMAREVLAANTALFGVDPGQLELDSVLELGVADPGRRDKVAVHLRQVVGGVPVYRSSVSALFLADGRLTAVFLQTLPVAAGFGVEPRLDREAAGRAAVAARVAMGDGVEVTPIRSELVIYPWVRGDGSVQPRLAWLVTVEPTGEEARYLPGPSLHVVSADLARPQILDEWRLVWNETIEGTVEGYATSGYGPWTPATTPQRYGMDRALVEVSGYCEEWTPPWNWPCAVFIPPVTEAADGYGNFDISGLDDIGHTIQNNCEGVPIGYGERCVEFGIENDYVLVNSQVDPESAVRLMSFDTPETVSFNEDRDEYGTAQVNAFKWVTRSRDWVRGNQYGPVQDPFLGQRVIANTNKNPQSSTCNAFFTWGATPAVHFERSHDLCFNTSFSTIIAHEVGHFLTWSFLGAQPADYSYFEGMADTFGMYISDYPVLAEGIGMPELERSGYNTLQYPDMDAVCGTESHCRGQVLMGAMWKLMRNYKYTYGNSYGHMYASILLNEWHKAVHYNGPIHPDIEIGLLVVDDDDGDIDNGTPHYDQIDEAFREQGFPGYDLPPQIHVTEPYGYEVWQLGSSHTIRWESRNVGDWVDIDVSLDGGTLWSPVVHHTFNDGSEDWIAGPAASSQALLRVRSVDDPSVLGVTPYTFSIATMAVIAPNGGESWPVGSTQTIRWSSLYLPGNVRIQLSRDGGGSWADIISSVANTGTVTWTVTGPATSQALIRIVGRTYPSVSDVSDGVFSVVDNLYVVATAGDGGDADTGDGACADASGFCTLRAAIEQANAWPGTQTIEFHLPVGGLGEVPTIRPGSELPTVSDPVIIDGTSQPTAGWVELDGSLVVTGSGLYVTAGSSQIRGLVVNRFPGHGIALVNGGGNVVERNRIGTSADGASDLGNGAHGITIASSSSNLIGGASAEQGNLISGNGYSGINLTNASGSTRIYNNRIGTDATGTTGIGNSGKGIRITGDSSNTKIGGQVPTLGNIIAFNGAQGLAVISGVDNSVTAGSIHSNGALAIDLNQDGVTANDPDDADEGANHLQNFPVISKAWCVDAILHIDGSLQTTPPAVFGRYVLQFYGNSTCDPSGHGEAQTYLGSATVSVDATGWAAFSFEGNCKTGPADFVVATATSTTFGPARTTLLSTSEVSACVAVDH